MSPRRSALDEAEPAADIPYSPARKKPRDRSWDKTHRKGEGFVSVNYRFIPAELRDEIKAIAQAEGVTSEDVARRFLEYARAAYRRGELRFEDSKVLVRGVYTLYPDKLK